MTYQKRTFEQLLNFDEIERNVRPIKLLRPLTNICWEHGAKFKSMTQERFKTVKTYEVMNKEGIKSLVILTGRMGREGYRTTEIINNSSLGEDKRLVQKVLNYYARDGLRYKNCVSDGIPQSEIDER